MYSQDRRRALVGIVLVFTSATACSSPTPSPTLVSTIPATSTPVTSRPTLTPRTPTAASGVVPTAGTPAGASTASADLASQLESAARHVDDAIAAVESGNLAAAKTAFAAYSEAWEGMEDGIKARAPGALPTIEDASDNASAELRATLSTRDTQLAALQKLREVLAAQVIALR